MTDKDTHISSTARGPRLFVSAALAAGQTLTVEGPQAHYLSGVLRVKPGAPVRLCDNISGEWQAVVASLGKRSLCLDVQQHLRAREQVPDLWLCAAPLKRGRIDWVAEKAAELGVARLVPVRTQYAVVDKLNKDRLMAHMIEAAEQCERTALPELADLIDLKALLAQWPAGRQLIFADEAGGTPMGRAALSASAGIVIGPEGGFSPEERALIRAHPQACAVALGPRILRADTAAAVAVGLWQARVGDWG